MRKEAMEMRRYDERRVTVTKKRNVSFKFKNLHSLLQLSF